MENSYLEIINKNKQIEIANIKECNLFTQKYGLILSDTQITSLIEKRKEALKNTGRVELRGGILDKLIKAFCDSPYIDQENYASTLYELVDIFYEYKNETQINALIEKAYKEIKEELFPQNVKLQKYIEKNLKTIVDIMANYSFRPEN